MKSQLCLLCIRKDELNSLKPGMTISIQCELIFNICSNCENLMKISKVECLKFNTKFITLRQSFRAENSVKMNRIMEDIRREKEIEFIKSYNIY